MSASDPELRRVAVHAGTKAAELTLPAAVPVATLVPSIFDVLGTRSTDPAASRYQLSRLGAPALQSSTTLAQNGIRDGAVLVLTQSATVPPAPLCDDVAETVSAALDAAGRGRHRPVTRLIGSIAACAVTAVGTLELVRNALSDNASQYQGITAAIAAAAFLIALLFAGVAHRVYGDALAGLTLSLVSTGFAAVAGALAVPGTPAPPVRCSPRWRQPSRRCWQCE